jgi:phosphatidylserine/phosphatidylglycerophosphate/cardiolipin synthase-like enzyme
MVHAKVAVVDGALAAVGSANMNTQSLRRNSETLLLSIEPQVVEELRELIVHEGWKEVDPISSQSWPRHPDRRRWAELSAAAVGLIL